MDLKIFDTLLEPTFVLDQEGRVRYCNEPAALICDQSVRKLMRSRPYIKELFRFTENIEALNDITQVQDASPYQETSFEMDGGKTGRVQLTLQPLPPDPEDGSPRWLVFFRDVTLEETLQRKYRAELEKKEHVIQALEEAQKKLEDYSRNLEKMVAERTAQLSAINSQMKALLDSLGQGFLIFDQQGRCLEIASKACEHIFETDPRGKSIHEVLRQSENETKAFQRWMATAFAEMLPFEDLAPLAPPQYAHSGDRSIDLGYFPLRTEGGAIEGLVLVGTDVTDLVRAQKQAELDRAQSKMVLELVKNRRQVLGFIREAEAIIGEIHEQLEAPEPAYDVTFRALHTLKGGAASFSVQDLVDRIHEGEEILGHWHESPSAENLSPLHRQVGLIDESFRQFLANTDAILGSRGEAGGATREVRIEELRKFYDGLKTPVMRTRFFEGFLTEKSAQVFAHFNDTVQSAASQLGKVVLPLSIDTPDFAFWPEPYQRLIASLVHAFRNAVDHGIETPDVREQRGKNPAGRISLTLEKNGERLLLRIQDDGNGIDPSKIRDRLAKKGFDTSVESDAQVIQHVFDSEFSTRDQVTALSGRGVGMDAIKHTANELGGRAWVTSVPGQGTACMVDVPWLTDVPAFLKVA